ncbi:MAG: hypothetical protein FWE95_11575, partial [Planctomycetaceae bacterium]|nr:hypothetical protein [Planctomycetaceae bacterium]
MSKRKYSSCCLGCLLCGIAALVLAVPVWYFCIYVPPLVISEATTRITGPLTADGQVDYFKALKERVYQYPPEFATDENGYRIFVRQFGYISRSRVGDIDPTIGGYGFRGTMSPEEHEFYRLPLYEQLGLDPDVPTTLLLPPEPLRVFVDYYEAKGEELPVSAVTTEDCCGLVTYTVQGESWTRPWTLEQFPMFADWLDEIDAPMDAIAEAVCKPVFFAPLLQNQQSIESGIPPMLWEILFYVDQFNIAGKILQARANYRIAKGDIDGAIDDTLTLLRLGRQLTQKASILQYRIGIGIEWMGMTVPVGANP